MTEPLTSTPPVPDALEFVSAQNQLIVARTLVRILDLAPLPCKAQPIRWQVGNMTTATGPLLLTGHIFIRTDTPAEVIEHIAQSWADYLKTTVRRQPQDDRELITVSGHYIFTDRTPVWVDIVGSIPAEEGEHA